MWRYAIEWAKRRLGRWCAQTQRRAPAHACSVTMVKRSWRLPIPPSSRLHPAHAEFLKNYHPFKNIPSVEVIDGGTAVVGEDEFVPPLAEKFNDSNTGHEDYCRGIIEAAGSFYSTFISPHAYPSRVPFDEANPFAKVLYELAKTYRHPVLVYGQSYPLLHGLGAEYKKIYLHREFGTLRRPTSADYAWKYDVGTAFTRAVLMDLAQKHLTGNWRLEFTHYYAPPPPEDRPHWLCERDGGFNRAAVVVIKNTVSKSSNSNVTVLV